MTGAGRRRSAVAGLGAVLVVAAAVAAPAAQSEAQRTSIVDNATVAVTRLRFTDAIREKMHAYPFALLLVQLTRGDIDVVSHDTIRRGTGPGEIWFLPANEPHAIIRPAAPAGGAAQPIDLIAIAIKRDRAPAPAAPATEAPPGITRTTFIDNADVRVVHVRFAPDGREPLHSHPNDLVTVQITPGRVEIVNGSERSTAVREPGFVNFLPRGVTHAYVSADTKPFELLSVAIK